MSIGQGDLPQGQGHSPQILLLQRTPPQPHSEKKNQEIL